MGKKIIDLGELKKGQILKIDELGSGVFFAVVTSIGKSRKAEKWVFEKRHVKENPKLIGAFNERGISDLSILEFNQNGRTWSMSLNTSATEGRFISPSDSDYNFSFELSSSKQVETSFKKDLFSFVPKTLQREAEEVLKSYKVFLKNA